jgi:hypothetical protein
MRRDEAFFGEQELVLLYIAKRLKEAKALESVLDQAELDYLVEPDTYRGGVLFVTTRIGAFFYSAEGDAARAREAMRGAGYKPYHSDSTG